MKQKRYVLLFAIMLSFFQWALAQEVIKLKGKVTEAGTGIPLIGVSVIEKGTTNGTVTNEDGFYELSDVRKGATVVFSYIGMTTKQVVVRQNNLNVELESDQILLQETVVVGYGMMRKSDLTGAVSKVDPKELTLSSSIDVNQALQGRVAGVTVVSNSGEPGAGTKVRIRGVGTINNSDPLYVVDGFPAGDISNISPNDIESMEILKDASATAIYGSRGANGVILVKTKSGSYGAQGGTLSKNTKVNVNIFGNMAKRSKKLQLLNAYEFAELKEEALRNAGQTPDESTQAIFDFVRQNQLVGTDWQDEIFRTAYSQNYNMSVTGGSEVSRFDIGATYSREQGTVRETDLDKFMLRANNTYRIGKHIELGINLNYTTYEKHGINGDYYSGPISNAITADPISAAFDSYTNFYGENYFSFATNPALSLWESSMNKGGDDRFMGNFFLQLDDLFIKGLSYRGQFGERLVFYRGKSYSPEYFITVNQQRIRNSLSQNESKSNDWQTSHVISYINNFDKHRVNAMVGMEAQKFTGENMGITVYDVPMNSDLQYISASTNKELFSAYGGAWHSSLLSYFVRANYSFGDRYSVTGTMRADGSSKFVDHWGYFPSFSLGWNIHNEPFFVNTGVSSNLITQLKLRAGWGQVGNQSSAGNHDYVSTMVGGYAYVFGGKPVDGAVQQDMANPELSWETAEQYNVGLDFALFNSRLSGTLEGFIRKTNDMILAAPIPSYAGMWKPRTNAGSIENKGVELSLNYNGEVSGFIYNVGLNLAHIRNKVTSVGGGDPIYGGDTGRSGNATRTEKGMEMGYFYGYKTDGLFNTQEELDAYVFTNPETGETSPIQPNAAPGDVKFVDLNNDGKIDANDRTKIGSPFPDLTMGLNFGASYKGFDLNFLLTGTFGNDLVNGMYSTLYSTSMFEWSGSKDQMNRWTPDNPNSNIPRLNAADPNKNTQFSDRFVENGTYVRMKTLQLGYTLPQDLTRKAYISRLRVYLSADNLFTITNYSGFDPEVGDRWGALGAGVDVAGYPVPRVFSAGINLTF